MVARIGKHPKRKQRTRRAHLKLKVPKLVACPQCGAPKPSHQLCLNCGRYKNRTVVDVLAKLKKKERKQKEKELEQAKATQAKSKSLNIEKLSRKQNQKPLSPMLSKAPSKTIGHENLRSGSFKGRSE